MNDTKVLLPSALWHTEYVLPRDAVVVELVKSKIGRLLHHTKKVPQQRVRINGRNEYKAYIVHEKRLRQISWTLNKGLALDGCFKQQPVTFKQIRPHVSFVAKCCLAECCEFKNCNSLTQDSKRAIRWSSASFRWTAGELWCTNMHQYKKKKNKEHKGTARYMDWQRSASVKNIKIKIMKISAVPKMWPSVCVWACACLLQCA